MNRFNHYCCLLCVYLLLAFMPVSAQQQGFIHMQTENNQFYEVEWNGKNYASSTTGYLLIPALPAGNHNLLIRFSGETVTEYTFAIEIDNKARGFSLRQSIDNSWSLFDLVELTLLKGTLVAPVAKAVVISKPPETAPKTIVETTSGDKLVVKKTAPAIVKTGIPVTPDEKINKKPTNVLKIFDKSSTSGIDQVYVLTNGTRLDTIALFIPALGEEQPKAGTGPAAYKIESKKNDQNAAIIYSSALLPRNRYSLFSK